MHEALRNYWYPVARVSEITDRPVATTLLDEAIALCRASDRVVALHDLCIHRTFHGSIQGSSAIVRSRSTIRRPRGPRATLVRLGLGA